jgi:hypothetical protein
MATKVNYPLAPGDKGITEVVGTGTSPALALIAGWLVPGAGHLIQANTGEPLDMLGFAGDLGAGLLYLLARLLGWGQAPVLVAVADYGTKFIVVAGLLNIVAAVDAHSLANGRKRS